MRRRYPLFLLLTSLMATIGSAQDNEADPFRGNYRLGNAAELMLIWSEPDEQETRSFQRIYDFVPGPGLNIIDSTGARNVADGNQGIAGNKHMDIITGNFYGDGADDIVAIWEGPERSINMMIPFIDKETFSIQAPNINPVSNAKLVDIRGLNSDEGNRQLQLAPAKLDNDSQDEFVLAYWAEDRSIKITVYDVNDNLEPIARADIDDISLPVENLETVRGSQAFALTAGDVDGDGMDEIVLVASQKLDCGRSNGCWQIILKIYSYDPAQQQLTASMPPHTFFTKEQNTSVQLERIAVATGDFNNDDTEEIAVAFATADNNLEIEYRLQTLAIKPDLSGVQPEIGENYRVRGTRGSQTRPVSIVTGDVDKNGTDEVILDARGVEVMSIDSLLKVKTIAVGDNRPEERNYTHRSVIFADLDADVSVENQDSIWRPEIVTVTNRVFNGMRSFQMLVHHYVPGSFGLVEIAEFNGEFGPETGEARSVYLAAGDFTNSSIRMGSPQRYRKTEIVEPIAIINAPPTHFDIINDVPFDITRCYNNNDCDFVATYETETERSVEVETVFNSDWSVGATSSSGFKIPVLDVGVEVELEAKYGRGFSKRNTNSSTFTVNQSVDAIVDDWIYAIILDYDVWEYPLFFDGELQGYVAVIIPSAQRQRAWFDSKSFRAHSYLPTHEVGNILSYNIFTEPEENSFLAEAIRWDTGDLFNLNSNSRGSWGLTSEGSVETERSFRESKFLGGSADFDIPFKLIPDFGIEGSYSTKKVSTYSSRLVDRQGLSIQFDNIDQSFGNTRYGVTPYVYWAQNGALVLDYSVQPELPPDEQSSTWWSINYGQKSDPAIILPWRYDPEKGFGLDEPAQRYRTRDILFDPPNPEPGDIITIKGRVQNFSLLSTPVPVEVSFYLGDPDEGGTRIVGINGETSIFSETTIADRSREIIEMQWRLPNNINRSNRIFMVLDENENIDEIHENNNKGWSVLEVNSTTSVESVDNSSLPAEFELRQNYPNPFNPTTTISYSVPKSRYVKLAVYDLLGREVRVLSDGRQDAGNYKVDFSGSSLPSGLYFIRLQSGEFSQVRRMLLLR